MITNVPSKISIAIAPFPQPPVLTLQLCQPFFELFEVSQTLIP